MLPICSNIWLDPIFLEVLKRMLVVMMREFTMGIVNMIVNIGLSKHQLRVDDGDGDDDADGDDSNIMFH